MEKDLDYETWKQQMLMDVEAKQNREHNEVADRVDEAMQYWGVDIHARNGEKPKLTKYDPKTGKKRNYY